MQIRVLIASLSIAAASPALAQHHHPDSAASPAFGEVNLPNSGAKSAQAAFHRGLGQLHNFEYSAAAAEFRQAQKIDPDFALAYWGEAMTHNHPLWAAQNETEARAILARFGATPAERRAKIRTPREIQWFDAIEALYGPGTKIERDQAYHAKMRQLFESDPEDVDSRAFYALATLGLASGGRDFGLYMQAAALLEEVFPRYQKHPGVLHYLIHAYDDPVHAPLGLRAARLYGAVAAGAGHAQHMTSHIYLALGLWPQAVEANVAAMAAVDSARTRSGQRPTFCGHYAEWRAYSLLQMERNAEASEIVDRCSLEAFAELEQGSDQSSAGAVRSLFNIWAIKAVRKGVDTGSWPDWSAIPGGDDHRLGRFWLAYGKLHSVREKPAALAAAHEEVQRLGKASLAALAAERPHDSQVPRWVTQAMVQADIVRLAGEGRRDEAIAKLRSAAQYEDGLPVEFGPPALPKPSWELLGDMLLAAGDSKGAAEAYRKVLVAAPGRRLAVLGLAQAAR